MIKWRLISCKICMNHYSLTNQCWTGRIMPPPGKRHDAGKICKHFDNLTIAFGQGWTEWR